MIDIQKIIKDIEKSGFLSELKVGQKLSSKNWKVSFGETYLDYDEKKSREIDIQAYKVKNNKDVNFQLVFTVLLEVKYEAKNPWVIFMTKDSMHDYKWIILHSGEAYMSPAGGAYFTKCLSPNPFSRKDKKSGTAFHEAFKKSDAPSKIYKALIGASKAAYHHKEMLKRDENVEKYSSDNQVVLEFYVPVVIVAGELFESHLVNDKIEVKEAKWLPVKLNYSSENYVKNDEIWFRPYIASLKDIDSFVEKIDEWVDSLYDNLSKSIGKLRNKQQ